MQPPGQRLTRQRYAGLALCKLLLEHLLQLRLQVNALPAPGGHPVHDNHCGALKVEITLCFTAHSRAVHVTSSQSAMAVSTRTILDSKELCEVFLTRYLRFGSRPLSAPRQSKACVRRQRNLPLTRVVANCSVAVADRLQPAWLCLRRGGTAPQAGAGHARCLAAHAAVAQQHERGSAPLLPAGPALCRPDTSGRSAVIARWPREPVTLNL